MAKGFAYLDKYGILHVVNDVKTAEKYTGNGKVEEIDFPHDLGYPTTIVKDKVECVIVHTDPEIREKDGLPIPTHIIKLVDHLKN